MIRFTVDVDGTAEFDRAFNRVEHHIADLTPVWAEVKQQVFEIEQDQFQSGGAKGASGKWAELSPKCEEVKIRKYGTFAVIAGPLIATERLYRSLSRETEDTVYIAEPQEMTIGTSVPYAGYHQKGTSKMPARPPISLSGDQKKQIQKRIQRKLLDYVRETGLSDPKENF
jgi:phage gpG-like protein